MAKSKKALKALKRRKEAKKRSRVVQERQDYREGGRVKANTGGLENLKITDFWKRGDKLFVKNKLVTPDDANYQGYVDRYNQAEAERVAEQQERQRVAEQQRQQQEQQKAAAATTTEPTTTATATTEQPAETTTTTTTAPTGRPAATAESPFNFTMDVPEGTEIRNIRVNDGFGNERVPVPWGALTEEQRQGLRDIAARFPSKEEETLRARAAYDFLEKQYGLLSDKKEEEEELPPPVEDEELDTDDLAGDTGDTDDRSDETREEIENPYVEKREIKGLANSQVENATGAFKDHLEKWGLTGGYTNTFGLFDKQETRIYWRNFRGWEQQNPEPDRFVNAQGQPTSQSVSTLGTDVVGTSGTSGNRINPKWNQWNNRRRFAHNDIVSNIIKLPRYGGVEGGEDSRYGQIKPVKTQQFGKGTTVPYKIPGLEADEVDKADVATVIDPETGEPSEDTEAETFEIDREEVAEVEEADQVTATDISVTEDTADQILKTKASELGVTAPTVEAYTSSSAN